MGLNATLSVARRDKEGAPAFFWGSSQAFADRLAGALTSQVFKETKTMGRAAGEGRGCQWWRRMTCQMRKKTYWKGQSGRKKKHIEPMEKYNLLTIWLGGWQQPSSVFLELYNTPNYSVRKIKESQRAVEWKREKKEQSRPNGLWIVEKLETLLAYIWSSITLFWL